MHIILQARSSSGGSYQVHFENNHDSVTVFCKCEAGIYRKLCKHKRALINGKASMLADPSQTDDLQMVRSWLAGSPILEAEAKLAKIEKEKARIVKEEKMAKTCLIDLLNGVEAPKRR